MVGSVIKYSQKRGWKLKKSVSRKCSHSKLCYSCSFTVKAKNQKSNEALEAECLGRLFTWIVAGHILAEAGRRKVIWRRRYERVRRDVNVLIVNIVLMLLLLERLMVGRLGIILVFTVALLLPVDRLRVVVLVRLVGSAALLVDRLVARPVVVIVLRLWLRLLLGLRLILCFVWRDSGGQLGEKSCAFWRWI